MVWMRTVGAVAQRLYLSCRRETMPFVETACGVVAFGHVEEDGTAHFVGMLDQALKDAGGHALTSGLRLDPHAPHERVGR